MQHLLIVQVTAGHLNWHRDLAMASRAILKSPLTRAATRLTASNTTHSLSIVPSRQSIPSAKATQLSSLPRVTLQQSFRRSYANSPTANLSPAPAPKRRFRFFRWIWRLAYISAIGGTCYLGYEIWQLRHPEDQNEPDPTKKTLVILGMHS